MPNAPKRMHSMFFNCDVLEVPCRFEVFIKEPTLGEAASQMPLFVVEELADADVFHFDIDTSEGSDDCQTYGVVKVDPVNAYHRGDNTVRVVDLEGLYRLVTSEGLDANHARSPIKRVAAFLSWVFTDVAPVIRRARITSDYLEYDLEQRLSLLSYSVNKVLSCGDSLGRVSMITAFLKDDGRSFDFLPSIMAEKVRQPRPQ